MKIVVDTNVVMSGLIKDSTTRRILALKNIDFFSPDFVVNEINKYRDYIIQKSQMSENDFDLLFALVMDSIVTVSEDEYSKFLEQYVSLISDIDDVPFLALCIALKADGIWTDDKHFMEQDKVKVFRTDDMIKLM